MTLADLQSNISISAQNAVTGDIEWCSGYTQFSTDIGEQAGWYLALQVTPDVEDATVTAAYNGTIRELDNNIFIIRLAEGEDSITFTANKEGYTEGRLTLDLSGLTKEALTQNILYTASLTNGVTVSPLQFGESKTITGQVPWNTTDNANIFNISMRPFEMVAPGTPWSIASNGVELAEGTFSTITPDSGSPYSFTGAKLTVTQEIISAQNPYLVVTVRPDAEDPTKNFYSSMNIGALTLAPDPRPKVNITSNTTNVTISPSTYATSKTATGQVPYDTTTQKNILSLALTTSGTLPTGPYTIEVFAQGDVTQQPIWHVAGASTIPQSIPIPLTSSEVGTGKYITVNTSGANDPEFNVITIDTSALTLEAAPTPSAPGFEPLGLESGLGDPYYNFFTIYPVTGRTTYKPQVNGDDACCIEITYDSTTTVSGHTQYNYSASSNTVYPGVSYWRSPTDGLLFYNINQTIADTVIMTRSTDTTTLFNRTSPLQPTSGEFLAGIEGNDSSVVAGGFSSQINAFVVFVLDFENDDPNNPYHYILKDSTNPSGGKIDMKVETDYYHGLIMIFAIAGANSTTIPQNNIVFKLYNSTGSDYVIINIDMSNVTATEWSIYST